MVKLRHRRSDRIEPLLFAAGRLLDLARCESAGATADNLEFMRVCRQAERSIYDAAEIARRLR